ncbi:hypothetical protein C8R45DRAFT_802948, partial [Mycena sanguinolenta]
LDDLHLAFTQYFGGSLCPISLDDVRPTRILELGWVMAIQAATQFPAAQLLAVDQSPLPDRYIPPNVNFQIVDLAKEVDFGPDKFDIVHARFALSANEGCRFQTLPTPCVVRPGGLLLVEDLDMSSYAETAGPAARLFVSTMKPTFDERGADMEFGKKIPDLIRSLDDFPNVEFQKITMPFGGS